MISKPDSVMDVEPFHKTLERFQDENKKRVEKEKVEAETNSLKNICRELEVTYFD